MMPPAAGDLSYFHGCHTQNIPNGLAIGQAVGPPKD